jgi:hypothetical protein
LESLVRTQVPYSPEPKGNLHKLDLSSEENYYVSQKSKYDDKLRAKSHHGQIEEEKDQPREIDTSRHMLLPELPVRHLTSF